MVKIFTFDFVSLCKLGKGKYKLFMMIIKEQDNNCLLLYLRSKILYKILKC